MPVVWEFHFSFFSSESFSLYFNHRNIEQIGLDRIFNCHLIPAPSAMHRDIQLGHVVICPVQLDFEHFLGWDIYHLSSQHGTVFHCSHYKIFQNSFLFQCCKCGGFNCVYSKFRYMQVPFFFIAVKL